MTAADPLAYRPEIDGLRAVAVVPVMLYHAGMPWLPGGFLGVDVFFVISGYLIARLIDAEIAAGSFSVLRFYERRARRILPALFLVMAATVPGALLWMPPDALQVYLRSLVATSLFVSNVHFHAANGYFSPDAEEQPLLHTWSLAVEEQYYLVFPLLLLLIVRHAPRRVLLLLAGLAACSLAVCLHQVRVAPDAAFYLIPARVWELLAGALLALAERRALWPLPGLRRWHGALSLAGIGAIGLGFVAVRADMAVPGVPTLLPVAGTVLVIATLDSRLPLARLLRSGPFLGLGLISYGAYLWHQPLLAFARLRQFAEPAPAQMLALLVAALLLAALSWRLVEQPFRRRGWLSRRAVFGLSGAAMAGMVGFGLVADRAGGFRQFDAAQMAMIAPPLATAQGCDWDRPVPQEPRLALCPLGARGTDLPPVLLWGDSHAEALIAALDADLNRRGIPGLFLRSDPCFRIPGVLPREMAGERAQKECEAAGQALFGYLAARPPRAIVVSLRWTLQLFPVPGAEDRAGFDNAEGGIESESHRVNLALSADGGWSGGPEAKAAAVTGLLRRLAGIAPVIVIGPVPEVGWDVGDANFKAMLIHGQPPPDISTATARFVARNRFVSDVLGAAAAAVPFARIEPSDLLCDRPLPGRCAAQLGGVPFYADDDHLSRAGADRVIAEVMQHLP